MFVYTIIILMFHVWAYCAAIEREDGKAAMMVALNMFLYLPFYGRIFGWW